MKIALLGWDGTCLSSVLCTNIFFFNQELINWLPDQFPQIGWTSNRDWSESKVSCNLISKIIAAAWQRVWEDIPLPWRIGIYYMATIVRPLWLAAEWALFSCNDWALWNFSRLFWVASKSNERVGENNKKDGQKVVQLYFQ